MMALDAEPRSFFELFVGENHATYEGMGGIGYRLTLPATEDFFIGFHLGAVMYDSGMSGTSANIGLAIDYQLFDDFFLSGNYGWDAYSNADSNITDATGKHYDLGVHYQFSQYVDMGIMYRNTDWISSTNMTRTEEEVFFVLSFQLTLETMIMFALFND